MQDEPNREELEVAGEVLDQLRRGTFYQRQVDALREMGFGAETLRKRLAAQGIHTD